MAELIHFFIETASISGEHLAGMLFVGLLALGMFMIFSYQILNLLIGWFKRIKPIKINKVEKVEKVVEVPKYLDKDLSNEIKQVVTKINEINKQLKNINSVQL